VLGVVRGEPVQHASGVGLRVVVHRVILCP
jgi:hypothetical protein